MKKFWLIWSPTGTYPPNYRHATRALADAEAKRLAAERPGQEFFVLGAESVATKETVRFERLDDSDDLPF